MADFEASRFTVPTTHTVHCVSCHVLLSPLYKLSLCFSITVCTSTESRLVNDTVIADPLFTAPVQGGAQFCYEVHGKPDIILNLVSDTCTIVNAAYEPMNVAEDGNIIGTIGISAADSDGNCHNIEVGLAPSGASFPIEVFIDDVEVSGVVQIDAVRVRRYSNRVRISVPNCELIDLVMWIMHMEIGGQNMLKFVITRGSNLAPTSHGLIGKISYMQMPFTYFFQQGSLFLSTFVRQSFVKGTTCIYIVACYISGSACTVHVHVYLLFV